MRSKLIILTAALLSLVSCLKNDLDYPLVPGDITSLEVEGQISVQIDKAARTVVVSLEEEADPGRLRVLSSSFSEAVTNTDVLPEYLDLSAPYSFVLKTYQDYKWTISATQHIERYVQCDNQAGKPVFDEENRHILLYVTDKQPLTHINFTGMKLGPRGSKVVSTTGYFQGSSKTEAVTFPMVLDCVTQRQFDVEYKGNITNWTLNAIQTAVSLEIKSVQAWARKVSVSAVFSGEGSPVVEYKKLEDETWSKFTDVQIDNIYFNCEIPGLKEDCQYQLRVRNGDVYSPVENFRTDKILQLDNSSFDTWHLDGQVWNPFPLGLDSGMQTWDTANKAVANWKNSISVPEDSFVAVAGEGKRAAKLESSYAVVKFASASMFSGYYVKLNGLGAELSWGVPFDSKPRALRGYYCYKPQKINYADKDHQDLMGQTDIGQIQVILTDWEEPFRVISTTKQFVDTENDPHIIAYANLLLTEDNEGYVEFTLPLEYRDVRTPRYIVVCMASSRYGDFFTGGVGSTLYLDEFSFEY